MIDFDEQDRYDGIWACSSILHLSRQELKQVLVHMEQALHKKVIRMENLESFGDDLIEAVKLILSR